MEERKWRRLLSFMSRGGLSAYDPQSAERGLADFSPARTLFAAVVASVAFASPALAGNIDDLYGAFRPAVDAGEVRVGSSSVWGDSLVVHDPAVSGADLMGTSVSDVFVVEGRHAAKEVMELHGLEGMDVAILPGSESDWTSRLPTVLEYPSDGSAGFGEVIVVESGGRSVTLVGVEQVVFSGHSDGYPEVLTPKNLVAMVDAADVGQVQTASVDSLLERAIAPLDDDELARLKFESSVEASQRLDEVLDADPEMDAETARKAVIDSWMGGVTYRDSDGTRLESEDGQLGVLAGKVFGRMLP